MQDIQKEIRNKISSFHLSFLPSFFFSFFYLYSVFNLNNGKGRQNNSHLFTRKKRRIILGKEWFFTPKDLIWPSFQWVHLMALLSYCLIMSLTTACQGYLQTIFKFQVLRKHALFKSVMYLLSSLQCKVHMTYCWMCFFKGMFGIVTGTSFFIEYQSEQLRKTCMICRH